MTVTGELRIPSRTTAIDGARGWVTGHLKPRGATDDAVWEIEMAVTEALANVMKHAYGGDETQVVDLRLRADDEQVEIEIADDGIPFDPAAYVPPDLDASPTGGYGVHLIESLMDVVERRPNGERGTIIRLVKRGWREH